MKFMTNITHARLELYKKRLLAYLEAEQAILTGQEYEIEGLHLTRADLKVVRDTIEDLQNEISKLESINNKKLSRPRFRAIVPRENF